MPLFQAGGSHLLDLTGPGVWSQEESLLHINVLEMRAVVLVLAAFSPELSGQNIVLMSDSTTVVVYLVTSSALPPSGCSGISRSSPGLGAGAGSSSSARLSGRHLSVGDCPGISGTSCSFSEVEPDFDKRDKESPLAKREFSEVISGGDQRDHLLFSCL